MNGRRLWKMITLAGATLLAAPPATFARSKHDVVFPRRDVPAPVTVRWFCESFEGAGETPLAACNAAAHDAKIAATLTDIDHAKHQCMELLSGPLAAKRLRFDAERARACVTARRAFVDDPGRPEARRAAMAAACDKATVGRRLNGEACGSALECVAGLACITGGRDGNGICAEPLKAGASCSTDQVNASAFAATIGATRSVCGRGSHCATASLDSRCAKDLPAGAACGGLDLGECGPGFRCSDHACKLEDHANAGAACKQDSDCRGVCDKGTCAARCGSG